MGEWKDPGRNGSKGEKTDARVVCMVLVKVRPATPDMSSNTDRNASMPSGGAIRVNGDCEGGTKGQVPPRSEQQRAG
jgi:hypothetical protein